MKKKIFILSILFAFFALPAFSNIGFEFGIGSGYVFYGSSEVKDRNKILGDTNQTILTTDGLFLLPVNDILMFSGGMDAVFDFRWKGSNHIYLLLDSESTQIFRACMLQLIMHLAGEQILSQWIITAIP